MSRKDVRGALVTCRVMTSLHWSGGAVGSDPGPMQQSFPEGETSDGDWWGTNQSSSWQQWNSSSWDSRPQSWQQQSWYAGGVGIAIPGTGIAVWGCYSARTASHGRAGGERPAVDGPGEQKAI